MREGDYLDECGGAHAGDALALRQREGSADVVYGRARRDDEGRLWLQYWFFYYYDDKGLLAGAARGRLGDGAAAARCGAGPEAATFARHAGGERLSWDEVELADSGEGPVLVVYPARGSHASLPRAGSFEAPVVPDHNDGLGPRVRPTLTTIADDGPGWVLWPGRWGATRRREFFEADSPRGPREHPQWWDPAELHREARPPGRKVERGRRIGPSAAGGRRRGSRCGGRGSWRWSPIASGSRGRERRRRASSPLRSTPAKVPAQRTRCRSKERGPSPCRCRASASGRGAGGVVSDRGVAGATVAVLFGRWERAG